MNVLQMITYVVVVIGLLFLAGKFLLRNRSKNCPECKRQKQSTTTWTTPANVTKDSDSESDLGDEEEKEL